MTFAICSIDYIFEISPIYFDPCSEDPQSVFNSFMTVSSIIRNQSIDLQNKLMDWFLYDGTSHGFCSPPPLPIKMGRLNEGGGG